MTHELPKLDYDYDALEPHIDAKTMEIHHSKHHQGYVNKLNAAVEGTAVEDKAVKDLLEDLESVPQEIRTAVRNNGGGHWNHTFFWKLLKKSVEPQGEAVDAIKEQFGSLEKFKEEFAKAAMTRFGSGWAWLVSSKDGKLEILSTANQDSPISQGLIPLLTLDVWEHAYYLKYQNKRDEYVKNFFAIIDWERVNTLYKQASSA
jgi:Fe-Mn family superoxide dismutase